MKGAKYVPMDFDSPEVVTTAETTHTSTQDYRSEPDIVEMQPVYTQRAAKKGMGPALFVAAPLALAAVVGGALYLGSASDDDLTTETTTVAETDAPAPFTETTDTLPIDVADAAEATPAPIPTPAPVAAQLEIAAATPAPGARALAPTPRSRPAPVTAPSAGDTVADVSATESKLPSAPVAYSATGPAAEPAPVAASAPVRASTPVASPTPAPAILDVEPITP